MPCDVASCGHMYWYSMPCMLGRLLCRYVVALKVVWDDGDVGVVGDGDTGESGESDGSDRLV